MNRNDKKIDEEFIVENDIYEPMVGDFRMTVGSIMIV